MKFLDRKGLSASENLAMDDSLLQSVDNGQSDEVFRVWEPTDYFVVLGYSCSPEDDVHLDYCRRHEIPLLRRISGGGTVLQGPGCLNYSLVLRIAPGRPLACIQTTNRYIMEKHRDLIEKVSGKPVEIQGHTDLTINNRKFSGNSQRRKKNALLFHGSFLLHFNLPRIEQCLKIPQRQPTYRGNRRHADFLVNLPINGLVLKQLLRRCWQA